MEYYVVYIVFVILVLINPQNNKIKNIIGYAFGIFICTTYFNGSDWRQYELAYKFATFESLKNTRYEIGFYLYMLIWKRLGINFFTFFIINKLIVFQIFNNFIKKYHSNYYLILCYFYTSFSLYFIIDCPFRNMIAVGITIFGQKYLLEKKYYKYIFIIFFASLFHSSALLCLSFIILQKVINLSRIKILIFILGFNVIFINQQIVLELFSKLPFFEEKIKGYINTRFGDYHILTLGALEKLLFIIIIILNKKYILKKDKNLLIGSLLYFLVYRLGLTFQVLSRLGTYVQIFYILSIVIIIEKKFKNLKRLLIIILLIYQGLVLNKTLNSSYVYLPYVSYLSYFFKEKPSYYERYYFHYREFFQKNNKKKEVKSIEEHIKILKKYDIGIEKND